MNKIKVLLVDDSNFMRIVLNDILSTDQSIQVLDTAVNGKEAFEKTMSLIPDVVLLDMTMKDYDGLYAIRNIMKEKPTPIVVLSASGNSNPELVIQAMEEGAYDFIHKPAGLANSKVRSIQQNILSTIHDAATVDVKKLSLKKRRNSHQHSFDQAANYKIIVIGSSTGGTGALEQILLNLPANLPVPIVIAQHMPADFLITFASRLSNLVSFKVKIAEDGESLKENFVYLNPGSTNMKIEEKNNRFHFVYTDRRYAEFNCPSVDCLMESVASAYGNKAIGVILTGMGRDGSFGLRKMFDKGAYTIAQDEKSSVVWGMPKAAAEAGAARAIVPLDEIPVFLVGCLS